MLVTVYMEPEYTEGELTQVLIRTARDTMRVRVRQQVANVAIRLVKVINDEKAKTPEERALAVSNLLVTESDKLIQAIEDYQLLLKQMKHEEGVQPTH